MTEPGSEHPSEAIDLLLLPRWLITVSDLDDSAKDQVLLNHGVAVNGGEIVAVESHRALRDRYHAGEVRILDDHLLIPGLVNSHTHSAMTLLRGYADDLPLMSWLSDHIWPAEAKWVNSEFVEVGTRLAMAEMIRGGTTCFNDMYFFPDVTATCAEQAGMRAGVGLIVIDFPTVWASDSEEYLSKGLELRDNLRYSSLVTTSFAPHAPYTVSDEPLERIATLANELDSRIHMHVHETAHEVEESMARFNMRPLERLDQLGLLGPNLSAVHMTQLLDGEIQSIAERGVSVIHCPESNLKLASGFCAAGKLLEAGVNVAIGTDGASSNNDLDLLGETRTAALLAKAVSDDPACLTARKALYAATMGGARAMGLEDRIGSIEKGKCADLVAVNLSGASTQPVYNASSQLIYSASSHQVSDSWVAGRSLLRDGQLTTLELPEVVARATQWGLKIASGRTQ